MSQKSKAPVQTSAKGGKMTRFVGDVRKADTKALITNGTDSFPEDSFVGTYWTGGGTDSVAILEPFFKPATLKAVVSQNNALLQCIEAMEVNIDGTGYSVELVEGAAESETEKKTLEDFFREPYPGKSLTEIRRAIRRDLESSGMGYMEVIRNAAGEVVMLNDLMCDDVRLVRLDDPVPVERVLTRNGAEVKVSVRSRERRYVQLINGKKVYFKEFGASRSLNRETGKWSDSALPVDKRASEIICFIGNKEAKTPYGSPRWINQLPSALGSRKAEEMNLDFFDGGGIPPVLVLVEGGTLGPQVTEDLKSHLSGKGNKSRAAVVEATSTAGTLDSSGSVKVRVERFGAERQQDAMFQTYDKNCEEHLRCAFRLPPMFIGKAQDYNFATAYTAYMVAEAQVFGPERSEFDDKINATIVKALGVKSYVFRSLPLTLVDVQNQLKALELASTAKAVSGSELVSKLNEVTGLSMEFEQQPETPPGSEGTSPTQPPAISPTPQGPSMNGMGVQKSEGLVQLAARWGRVVSGSPMDEEERQSIRKQVSSLSSGEAEMLASLTAVQIVSQHQMDNLKELCGCANAMADDQ